jgi:hypothetical protein
MTKYVIIQVTKFIKGQTVQFMKKIILSLFFVGMFASSFAQTSVAIGIKAGPNFSRLDGTSSVNANYENRTGWHGGAFLLIKLGKVGIQPELLYSKQGATINVNQRDLNANYSYVNVPVIVKLYTVAGINLQIGPQFGFIANAERDEFNEATGTVTTENVDDKLKGSDISLALGAGWDLPFGLTIDARYNLGLTKIDDSDPDYGDVKSQVIQISLGYKLIKLGK